jgi:broad specificity phosphatase PhoE
MRHAEVEADYQGVFGGRIDMDLSPNGVRQATALAKYLHGKPMDVLYASPMKRVQQTLAPLLLNGIPSPVVLHDLREVDFGDWTGLRWGQVQVKYGISPFTWLAQLERAGIPNAECAETLRARIEPCLRRILRDHAGRQIAIACHGGVIRVLLALLFDWPLSRMAAFEVDYASLTQVALFPDGPRFQLVNFTSWREMEL